MLGLRFTRSQVPYKPLPGRIAHYKFNTGLTRANGLIETWADQSGNGNDLTQATTANRPLDGSRGANLVTETIVATDWSAFGSNTLADAVDGGVEITYVDNATGARLFFSSGVIGSTLEEGSIYLVTYEAKVNTGSFTPTVNNGEGVATSGNAVSSETYVSGSIVFTHGANIGSAHLGVPLGEGQVVTIRNPTVQKITQDGVVGTDGIQRSLAVGSDIGNQPISGGLLLNQISHTAGDVILSFGNGCVIKQGTNSGEIVADFGTESDPVTLAIGTWGVLYFVINGASSVLQIDNGTPVEGNFGANEPTNLIIGADHTPANWSDINAKELIVYSGAHAGAEIERNILYLASIGKISL